MYKSKVTELGLGSGRVEITESKSTQMNKSAVPDFYDTDHHASLIERIDKKYNSIGMHKHVSSSERIDKNVDLHHIILHPNILERA